MGRRYIYTNELNLPGIIKWIAPPEPFIKLDTDCSSLNNLGLDWLGQAVFCAIVQAYGFLISL